MRIENNFVESYPSREENNHRVRVGSRLPSVTLSEDPPAGSDHEMACESVKPKAQGRADMGAISARIKQKLQPG